MKSVNYTTRVNVSFEVPGWLMQTWTGGALGLRTFPPAKSSWVALLQSQPRELTQAFPLAIVITLVITNWRTNTIIVRLGAISRLSREKGRVCNF